MLAAEPVKAARVAPPPPIAAPAVIASRAGVPELPLASSRSDSDGDRDSPPDAAAAPAPAPAPRPVAPPPALSGLKQVAAVEAEMPAAAAAAVEGMQTGSGGKPLQTVLVGAAGAALVAVLLLLGQKQGVVPEELGMRASAVAVEYWMGSGASSGAPSVAAQAAPSEGQRRALQKRAESLQVRIL